MTESNCHTQIKENCLCPLLCRIDYIFVTHLQREINQNITYKAKRFQSFALSWSGGRGGRGLTGLDAKRQSYHQSIEMKLCMRHYRHKGNANAKFMSGSFSILRDIASQGFPPEKGTVIEFGYLPPGNGFN